MKKLLIGLIALMILTACTDTTRYNYEFTGESEHWEAKYSYEGIQKWGEDDGQVTYSNKDSGEFILKYKGTIEELSSMRELEYSYLGVTNQQSFNESPTKVIFSSRDGSGGEKLEEDKIIQVNVKWNDLEESFQLENNNK